MVSKDFSLSIIPLYKCNFNCNYCYLGNLKNNNTILDLSLLQKRIKELKSFNINITEISIYGGEISLLDISYIKDLINIIKDYKFSFVTNLSNLKFIKFLNDNNYHYSFSLNKERDFFKETLKNIKYIDKNLSSASIVVLPSILNENINNLFLFLYKICSNVAFIPYRYSINSNINYNISNFEFSNFLKKAIETNNFLGKKIEIRNEIDIKNKNYSPLSNGFIFINPYGNFSSVSYENEIESFIEFKDLKEWNSFCKKEEKEYYKNCYMCEFYNCCKAEHLISFNKEKECSGLYHLLKWYNKKYFIL